MTIQMCEDSVTVCLVGPHPQTLFFGLITIKASQICIFPTFLIIILSSTPFRLGILKQRVKVLSDVWLFYEYF